MSQCASRLSEPPTCIFSNWKAPSAFNPRALSCPSVSGMPSIPSRTCIRGRLPRSLVVQPRLRVLGNLSFPRTIMNWRWILLMCRDLALNMHPATLLFAASSSSCRALVFSHQGIVHFVHGAKVSLQWVQSAPARLGCPCHPHHLYKLRLSSACSGVELR